MYSIRSTLAGHKRNNNGQPRVQNDLVPILFARIRTGMGKPKPKTIRILLDSGASASIFNMKYLSKLRLKRNQTTTWTTAAGNFTTSCTTKVQFTMPELYDDRVIEWIVHVAKDTGHYDAVIGRDLLRELGITLNFKDNTVKWDDSTIHMRSQTSNAANAYFIRDSTELEDSTTRVKRILDAKYEKADLDATVSNCKHLEPNQKSTLLTLLKKYEPMFDGTLGKWTGDPYHIELKPNVTPYHARAYPIPRIHEQTL
jgi:predicted aspartyl protease